ncbi:AraC family transcriptional regulator [Variovorax sp. dw_308]|uniref:AraC family transcriptional regulator n=1 Tax=Variovorax sp. dw_308 TaxID=2721546 RepID=UPI001C46B37A|nr:AraC family transcriptional regulator [Variovorax sp. dw_308]
MSFWDFNRSPASARLLVDFGRARGVEAGKLLARTGLSMAQLADPKVSLSATQELCVARNLLRQLKGPAGLGIEVGARYHFSTYGMWGYGLISSATMGEAIALALRFISLTFSFTFITFHLEDDDLCMLNFGEPDLEDSVRTFLVERDMAAAAVLMQELAGQDFRMSRFTLRHSGKQPASAAADAQRILGIAPDYGARLNSLVFRRCFLERRLPQANPITVSMCEQMCAQLIEQRRSRLGTAGMIKQYLDATTGGALPQLAALASHTNTSQRTLKRRLKDEGTSFRELLAASRGAMAKELLADEALPLNEIAERLGFADLSSFSQAFKRWFGVAPGAFRRGTK